MKSINDYYAILGVGPRASSKELKKAYRGLVRKWHPDKYLRDPQRLNTAKEKLQEINEAYHALQLHLANPTAPPFQSAGKTGRESRTANRQASKARVRRSPASLASLVRAYFALWQKPLAVLGRVLLETAKDPWIIAVCILMLALAIAIDWFY